LTTENGKLDTAREWEAATRKEFSGQAAREKELVTAWKKHNPKMTTQEIQEAVDAGLAPPKPTQKGKTAGPGTVDPFAGRK
jgi:hypothetical protein